MYFKCIVLSFYAQVILFLIQVGEVLPSIDLHESTPGNSVNILELFKGKKGVLFAVPGAFTPGCSKVLIIF